MAEVRSVTKAKTAPARKRVILAIPIYRPRFQPLCASRCVRFALSYKASGSSSITTPRSLAYWLAPITRAPVACRRLRRAETNRFCASYATLPPQRARQSPTSQRKKLPAKKPLSTRTLSNVEPKNDTNTIAETPLRIAAAWKNASSYSPGIFSSSSSCARSAL